MAGLLFFLVLVMGAAVVWRLAVRQSGARVHDGDGHRVFPDPARLLALVAGPLLLLLIFAGSVRVVPVGHALVVFNTLTRGFRLARQGITFIPPFISNTQ